MRIVNINQRAAILFIAALLTFIGAAVFVVEKIEYTQSLQCHDAMPTLLSMQVNARAAQYSYPTVTRNCSRSALLYSADAGYGFGSVVLNAMTFAVIAHLEGATPFWDNLLSPFGSFALFFRQETLSYQCAFNMDEPVSEDEFADESNIWTAFPQENARIPYYLSLPPIDETYTVIDYESFPALWPARYSQCSICRAPALADSVDWSLQNHKRAHYERERHTRSRLYHQWQESGSVVLADPFLTKAITHHNMIERTQPIVYPGVADADLITTPLSEDDYYNRTLRGLPLNENHTAPNYEWPPTMMYFYRRRWMKRLFRPATARQADVRALMLKHHLRPRHLPLEQINDNDPLEQQVSKELAQDALKINEVGQRYIAVHVRRGDKLLAEMHFVDYSEYIDVIEQRIMSDRELNATWSKLNESTALDELPLFCSQQMIAELTSTGQQPYYQPVVVFFSDDVNVYHELPMLRPCWRWIPLSGPPPLHTFLSETIKSQYVSERELAQAVHTSDAVNSAALNALRYWSYAHSHLSSDHWVRFDLNERTRQTIEFFNAIIIAAEAEYVVMTETSNIGRLLQVARGGWNHIRTTSVDTIFYDYF